MRDSKRKPTIRPGIGQLTLVEHSLCPLNPRASLVDNFVHEAQYQFSNPDRKRRTARARVFCPLGLSANDELYLWGLLALTMSQHDSNGELRATPHWCLRQLGLVDQHSRRGGRQYRQFSEAFRRLSTVSYLNDCFFDPVRAEHRQVSFGLLSYSLPLDPNSCRVWRIVWDPLFFEIVSASAGHFRFDLKSYRELDTASRRLFLFACKVFSRSRILPHWELRQLAVDLLGFSPSLAIPDMKLKVNKCINRLRELAVIGSAEYSKTAPGRYRVRLTRGTYFERRSSSAVTTAIEADPLWETLLQIGFEPGPIRRLIRRFPRRILEEWADITQAASERFGSGFFGKSPMAYLVDSVTKAAKGNRTPPDWWHAIRRKETAEKELSQESQRVFDRVRSELFDTSGSDSLARTKGSADMSSVASVLKRDHSKAN